MNFLRQSLKRSKEDIAETNKFLNSKPQVRNNLGTSNWKREDPETYRVDTQLLAIPKEVLVKEGNSKGCSPLISRSYQYPELIDEDRDDSIRYRHAGYAEGICWMFCNKTLNLWTRSKFDYGSRQELPMDDRWTLTFKEDIVCVQIGKANGMLHLGRKVKKLLTVALLGEMQFFCFDGRKIEDLGISLVMDEQVHEIAFTSQGNIIRAGSNGYAQMLVCNSQTREFEGRVGVNFWTRVRSLTKLRPKSTVLQILIDDEKKVVYCLVSDEIHSSWLIRKLFQVKNGKTTRVVVYDFTGQQIQLRNEFSQERLKDKLLTSNLAGCGEPQETYIFREVQILSMFLPKRGLLGLVLKSGIFLTLKNTSALEFEAVAAYSTAVSPSVLFEILPLRTVPPYEIQQSLGLDNLNILGGKIAYLGGSSVDILQRPIPLEGQLVEVTNKEEWIRHSPLEMHREWFYFHGGGIEYIHRYTLCDKLFILLEIQLSRTSASLQQKLYVLYNQICEVVGVVEFCCNLIQICCNARLLVNVSHELYESTARKLQETESSSPSKVKENSERQISQPRDKIFIQSSPYIRDAAKQLLRRFEYIPVRGISSEPQNIYTECLGVSRPPSSDSLWYSILLYFNFMYEPIRNKNVNFFKEEPPELLEFLGKLDTFSSFLLEKEKDLMTTRGYDIPIKKKNSPQQYEVDPMEIENVYTQQSRPKIRPQIMPGTNDYPVNSTALLIGRMTQMVERTYLLVAVLSKLAFLNIPEEFEPTLHQYLTTKQAQALLRNRIFRSISLDDPLILRIQRLLPQVITKEDVAFEQWMLNFNRVTPNFAEIVKILDLDRLEQVRAEYFNTNNYREFYELLLRRLKHLQDECKILEASLHQLNSSGSYQRFSNDRQMQVEQVQEYIRLNNESYSKQLQYLLKDVVNTIEGIHQYKDPQDILKLDHILSAVYKSNQLDALQQCLKLLDAQMMVAQARYLRTHDLLAPESLQAIQHTGWK